MARVPVSNRRRVLRSYSFNGGGTPRVEVTSDAGLLVTGDLDLQVLFQRSNTAHFGALLARLGFTGTTYGFYFAVDSAAQNRINYRWSPTGSSANLVSKVQTLTMPIPLGAPIWLRVTHDVDNGASGNDVRFYLGNYNGSVNPPATWIQLGTTQTTAGVTSIYNPASQGVTVGSFGGGAFAGLPGGNIYRAIVKNGIDGPNLIDFDPTNNFFFNSSIFLEGANVRVGQISGGVTVAKARPAASGRVTAP